jgi:hypothetical protein
MELAFARPQHLCAPTLDRLSELPAPKGEALGTAFGLTAGASPESLALIFATREAEDQLTGLPELGGRLSVTNAAGGKARPRAPTSRSRCPSADLPGGGRRAPPDTKPTVHRI